MRAYNDFKIPDIATQRTRVQNKNQKQKPKHSKTKQKQKNKIKEILYLEWK